MACDFLRSQWYFGGEAFKKKAMAFDFFQRGGEQLMQIRLGCLFWVHSISHI